MQLVGEPFRMFFFLHSVQLNLAGGDGMARLVAVNTLSQQLKREECECVYTCKWLDYLYLCRIDQWQEGLSAV